MHEADWIAITVILAIAAVTFLRLFAGAREAIVAQTEAERLAKQRQEEEQAAKQAETPVVTGA